MSLCGWPHVSVHLYVSFPARNVVSMLSLCLLPPLFQSLIVRPVAIQFNSILCEFPSWLYFFSLALTITKCAVPVPNVSCYCVAVLTGCN